MCDSGNVVECGNMSKGGIGACSMVSYDSSLPHASCRSSSLL
jgi:hypothetical protein